MSVENCDIEDINWGFDSGYVIILLLTTPIIRQCCLWGCSDMHMEDASQRLIVLVSVSRMYAAEWKCLLVRLSVRINSGWDSLGLTGRGLTESVPCGCISDLASSHPEVRRCRVLVVAAVHAGTGLPTVTAVSLLHRWSLPSHHPNKASYWLS